MTELSEEELVDLQSEAISEDNAREYEKNKPKELTKTEATRLVESDKIDLRLEGLSERLGMKITRKEFDEFQSSYSASEEKAKIKSRFDFKVVSGDELFQLDENLDDYAYAVYENEQLILLQGFESETGKSYTNKRDTESDAKKWIKDFVDLEIEVKLWDDFEEYVK